MKIWPWSTIRELRRKLSWANSRVEHWARYIDKLERENRRLEAQLASVKPLDPGAAGAMDAHRENSPDFVMLGLTRPDGSKRVYASRDLPQAEFRLPLISPIGDVGAYQLTSAMTNMLVVDKPAYDEAMARIREIWANWDREKAALPGTRKAIGG